MIALALGAAACNAVFGLDPVGRDDAAGADDAPGDAAQVDDAGPIDAVEVDARCPVPQVATFGAVADTTLIENDSQAHGDVSVINVSASLHSLGLIQFDVAQLPATAQVLAAELDLRFPPKATACSSSCGDCAGLDSAGVLGVQYLRSTWTEAANWSSPWASPGAAMLGVDRSAVAAAMPHADDTSTSWSLPAALLATWPAWREPSRISFVLSPGTATAIIATREYPTLEASCATGTQPPVLTVHYCP